MLAESEAVEAYSTLTRAAIEAGLKWVVVDAEQQIALGVEEAKVLKGQHRKSRQSVDVEPFPSGKFVVSRPLDSSERLRVMIDALQAATSGLSAAVVDTVDYLDSVGQAFDRVVFASDSQHEDTREIRRSQLPTREAIAKLDRLLHELKEAL